MIRDPAVPSRILQTMSLCTHTCMNKTTHSSALRTLPKNSNNSLCGLLHPDSAHFACLWHAKWLLPHVWMLSQGLPNAHASMAFCRLLPAVLFVPFTVTVCLRPCAL